jgi:hypothetical protein
MTSDDKRSPVTRIIPRSEGRVAIGPITEGGRAERRATLLRLIDAIKERRLAGTKKLIFGDLLAPESGLVIKARAKRMSPISSDIPDVVNWLNTTIMPSSTKKFLVLAGPGEGKTTTSLLLHYQMAEEYVRTAIPGSFPLLIDLRSERSAINAPDYGTVEWFSKFVEAHYGSSVKMLCNESTSLIRPLCIILDSLDEVLAGRSLPDVRSILERYMFAESTVVLCRSHFYEQYLQYLPFVTDRETLMLSGWDSDDVLDYIKAFYGRVRPDSHAGASDAFVAWIKATPSLSSILRVPIRLNMALDMYSPEGDVFPQHKTLLQLYEAYISWSINLERSRSNIRLEDIYKLLEDIAWETYGERDATTGKTSGTTERSLRTFLAARSPTASNDEIEASLSYMMNLGLLAMSNEELPSRDHAIDFVHKSFQECLVATRVAGAITTSAQDSATMCASYLTPEVSEFLKEAIERLNVQPREISKAVTILMDGIARAGTTDILLNTEPAQRGRKRLMLEQLCYYLGNLESRTAQSFLLNLIESETDEWIRRGIAIGLAFGGQYKPLEKYLKELRDERNRGGKTPKSDANIGFHLSFFGDQPFDPEYPDRDMGFDECGKTVERLVYQLGTHTNRPNWRIDLYTLLDLRNRAASDRSYWARMRANMTNLCRIYEQFARIAGTKEWLEVRDLGELLKDDRLGRDKS